MSDKRATLKVVIHDDGKKYHIRPLTTTFDEGANYQCNKYERITTLVEPVSEKWCDCQLQIGFGCNCE